MTMAQSITLGGAAYPVAPLKFRDLKRILPLFLDLGIDSEARIEAQGDIIAAAIRTAQPSFTRAAFDELSPTLPELQAAIAAIAILSGLEPRGAGGQLPGEARAASASPGATSMG